MKTLVVFPNKELLYAASTLGGEVAALVFSEKEAEAVSGKAHKILVAEVDPRLPDAAAEAVAKAAAGYDLVLMPSTKTPRRWAAWRRRSSAWSSWWMCCR